MIEVSLKQDGIILAFSCGNGGYKDDITDDFEKALENYTFAQLELLLEQYSGTRVSGRCAGCEFKVVWCKMESLLCLGNHQNFIQSYA